MYRFWVLTKSVSGTRFKDILCCFSWHTYRYIGFTDIPTKLAHISALTHNTHAHKHTHRVQHHYQHHKLDCSHTSAHKHTYKQGTGEIMTKLSTITSWTHFGHLYLILNSSSLFCASCFLIWSFSCLKQINSAAQALEICISIQLLCMMTVCCEQCC